MDNNYFFNMALEIVQRSIPLSGELWQHWKLIVLFAFCAAWGLLIQYGERLVNFAIVATGGQPVNGGQAGPGAPVQQSGTPSQNSSAAAAWAAARAARSANRLNRRFRP